MARRGRRRTKRRTLQIKLKPSVAREIWAITYLVLGILTILSIQGAFGVLGDFWVGLLSPILGWGVYVIPPIFILIAGMMFFSHKINFGASKTLGFVVFLISILSIFHLSVPIEKIHDFAALGRYGGYTGFVTNFILLEVLGVSRVGATIIFVALFVVSLLLIFEVSLREMAAFFIPDIKIKLVKEARNTRGRVNDEEEEEEEEMEELEQPEIMIRKSLISSKNNEKNVDVIYDKNEEEDSDFDPVKVEEVTTELSNGEKAAEEMDEYEWEFPSLDLLKKGDSAVTVEDDILMANADKIKKKLIQFGIDVVMHEVNVGPTVIQYTLKPNEAVKLSKITSLKNDMALALAAERIRIEAPIPGKSLVGVEVPNPYRATVYLREILESGQFTDSRSKLTLPLGRDVTGKPVIASLDTMPHLLIAGATGSGKSVAMNVFLISLLYQNSPKDLKLIMIDPKRVELGSYNSIPHLLTPVIQDPEKASIALRWVVAEMSRRYTELSNHRVRNLAEYNDIKKISKMPRIVVVVDELADLMMTSGKEVEASICRIAQMARAVGIHLIIATQRPSVDVITGLIKANIPTRISFAVSSSIDSRTILDGIGAEDLLGKGDMLYLPTGMNKPVRVQGIYISTEEIERITNRIKLTVEPNYDETITSIETAKQRLPGMPDSDSAGEEDDMYDAALELVRETKKASASLLQRHLKLGYARAARLIDLLEKNGVVGPADGAKPRKIMGE